MPEGPEVRRCAEQLEQLIFGLPLQRITVTSGKLKRQYPLGSWSYKDPNLPIVEAVHTKGKAIFIRFAGDFEQGDFTLVSTLGMAGWWYPADTSAITQQAYLRGKLVSARDVVQAELKHTRLEMVFRGPAGEVKACYTDSRNFGNIKVVEHQKAQELADGIGLDLLSEVHDDRTLAIAVATLKRSKRMIGEALLDQSLLAGLGNIYRAEALYLAQVNPYKRVNLLTDLELDRLVWAAVQVLAIAYHTRGSMLYPKDLLNVLDFPAKDHSGHLVYGKQVDPYGNKVNSDKLGGRTMWYCPDIQTRKYPAI